MLTSTTYDNTGVKYNVTRVITEDLDFDLAKVGGRFLSSAARTSETLTFPGITHVKYKAYSPMYISQSYSFSYGLNFAAVTGIVFHTFLYNRKDIIAKLRDPKAGGEDIHKRLMRSYKDVPDWWYGLFTIVIIGLGIFTTWCVTFKSLRSQPSAER